MCEEDCCDDREIPTRFPLKYLSNVRYSSFLSQNSDALIGVVNKLQDVVISLGQEAFKFPQIVVVGDQSTGKSSLLEGLIGRSFLPRGPGTVTRRPLLLRIETSKTAGRERVVFRHLERVFTDMKEVMKEIERETDRAAGTNKGLCFEPIVMTLYSPQAASELTLVDLPGVVKVPMGDQPEDIETKIHELILHYVSNPNSIILAVISANTDMATSESLKIAREVDPDGERTLAVVTKLDIMDRGTSALDILSGNIVPVKLGIIGVVNRSQKDIVQGKSLKEAAMEEMNFFYKNYPTIAHKNGRSFLAKSLQNLLINHVKKYLPELKSKVHNSLSNQNYYLKLLQGPSLKNPQESLLQMVTNFATCFISQVRGQYNELDVHELKGGARISYVFHEVFGAALNSINPLEGYSKSCILTAVRNSAGAKPCIFVPESCFELILKQQISRLEAPSLRCLQLVYDEMQKILYNCGNGSNYDMVRFPKLWQKTVEITLKLLKSRIADTESLVVNIIAIQGAYINTAHPDFHRDDICSEPTSSSLVSVGNERVGIPLVATIEKLVLRYFNIVRKEVQDMVPKAIMHSFVNHVLEKMHAELVSNLYVVGVQSQELLEESITIVEQKKNAQRIIETLERANNIISEINEGSLSL